MSSLKVVSNCLNYYFLTHDNLTTAWKINYLKQVEVCVFTKQVFQEMADTFKNNKSSGSSEILPRYLKERKEALRATLPGVFLKAVNFGFVPSVWKLRS